MNIMNLGFNLKLIINCPVFISIKFIIMKREVILVRLIQIVFPFVGRAREVAI